MKSSFFLIQIILFFILIFCVIPSSASEFYISPTGNDENVGSKEKPFKTVERAKQAVLESIKIKPNEDCTIWFEDGFYFIQKPLILSSEQFGNSTAKIEFKAVPETKPVISGGVELKDWRKNKSGLWTAKMPKTGNKDFYPRELFIDNKRAIRARFPNDDYLRVKKVGDDRRTNFFYAKNDFPIPENTENLELILLHDWSISRIRVKEIDVKKKNLIAVDSIGAKNPAFFNLDNWEKNPRYFLENAIEFLDAEYEWFYNSEKNEVVLKLPKNQNPDWSKIVFPYSKGLVQLNGTEKKPLKNIDFEGITFRHSLWNLPALGYCGVQACHFDSRPPTGGWNVVTAAIYTEWAENCHFKNCVFENLGNSGLWFSTGSKNCSVSNSAFYDISGNGIMIGEGQDRIVNGKPWWQESPEQVALGNRIENCSVKEAGKQFYGAVGIWCGLSAETKITNNEIYDLPYSGISIGWMWSPVPTPCRENSIDGNHIHHILNILSDGGGIYMLGLQPGSKLINNHIHDVKINAGRAESNGMFLDEGTTDVLIENNLIYNIA